MHYSAAAARRLHTIPLGALLAILSCKHLGLSSSLQVPSLSLLARYTAFAFVPALTTLLVPAFVGVLRVLVFGESSSFCNCPPAPFRSICGQHCMALLAQGCDGEEQLSCGSQLEPGIRLISTFGCELLIACSSSQIKI